MNVNLTSPSNSPPHPTPPSFLREFAEANPPPPPSPIPEPTCELTPDESASATVEPVSVSLASDQVELEGLSVAVISSFLWPTTPPTTTAAAPEHVSTDVAIDYGPGGGGGGGLHVELEAVSAPHGSDHQLVLATSDAPPTVEVTLGAETVGADDAEEVGADEAHYVKIAGILATKSREYQAAYWAKVDPQGTIKPIFEQVLARRASRQNEFQDDRLVAGE